MKIGDPVEFQMSFDRKTGKPIAIAVVPMEAGSVLFEVLGEEKLKGTVVQSSNANKNKVNSGVQVVVMQLKFSLLHVSFNYLTLCL